MIALLMAAAAGFSPVCSRVTVPFVGTICSPRGAGGKRPAMLLLGGSEGGDSMARAAVAFARKGYVAASVAYFGIGPLPRTLVNIPVETVGAALKALRTRTNVDASRIGILGVSKGGEFALLAASTYPQFRAVVAVVPSPVAFMGLGEMQQPSGCSWSVAGKPLPCVPADVRANQAIAAAFYQGGSITLKGLYDASLDANPATTRAAYFRLERIHGPVLCMAGADDAMWNSPRQCDMASSYLRARRHRYADRAIVYPNAGHTFLFALNGPRSAVVSYAVPNGGAVNFGGTPDGDAAAADAAWKAIWSFLSTALR